MNAEVEIKILAEEIAAVLGIEIDVEVTDVVRQAALEALPAKGNQGSPTLLRLEVPFRACL
jgi:hypothetical protein